MKIKELGLLKKIFYYSFSLIRGIINIIVIRDPDIHASGYPYICTMKENINGTQKPPNNDKPFIKLTESVSY